MATSRKLLGGRCCQSARSHFLAHASEISDTTWAALEIALTTEQLLDLLLLAGWYHAISFAANAARVPAEDGAPRFDDVC